MLGASLGHFSVNFGFYFVVSWMPLYLVQDQGYSLTQMAGIGGLVYLAYAGASAVSGWISDRWIGAGGAANRVRKTFFVGGHLLATGALLACAFGTPAVALASLFVTGVAFGTVGPHIFATGQTLAGPRAAGKWMGVQNCFSNTAGILGPIATGVLVDRTGGFHAAFIMTAALSLLGVVGWGLMIRKIAPLDWAPPRAA